MPLQPVDKVWMNGQMVDWKDATVHVLSHALHYGTGVFEGIRCYETSKGPAVFRLREHMERLHRSGRIFQMEIPYSVDELVDATMDLIKINELRSCYVRPIAIRGYGEMGIYCVDVPIDVTIAVWPWGSYLGEEGMAHGVRMMISSWRRHDPNIIPPTAKATGAYVNSVAAKIEAVQHGFDEAIMLNPQGYVAEATGENIYVVKGGEIFTPPFGLRPPRGHHARFGDHDRARSRNDRQGGATEPGRPLSGRGDVLQRNRGRGHPRPGGRRTHDRRAGPHHHDDSAEVLRHREGRGREIPRLAGVRGVDTMRA